MDDATLQSCLVRIETKLDAVIASKDDHERRLRALEQRVWYASGMAAALAALLTTLTTGFSR